MDFTFNEDQTAILEAVKEFCDEELAPNAQALDEAAGWPGESVKKQGEVELMGLPAGEVIGGRLGSFGLREPGAGSDAAAVATAAVEDGDHYVLNGTKIFISNGGEAEIYVIITRTDRSRGGRGMTAVVVGR